MAERVMEELGGSAGSAQKLSARSFYSLSILASLDLDETKAAAPIFGVKHLR